MILAGLSIAERVPVRFLEISKRRGRVVRLARVVNTSSTLRSAELRAGSKNVRFRSLSRHREAREKDVRSYRSASDACPIFCSMECKLWR